MQVTCYKGVAINSQLRKRRWTWVRNSSRGVVRSEGRIAQETLLRVISRKLTVKSRQNPFFYGRGTRNDKSYIVNEKLLMRKKRRRNKRRSGQWKQGWNQSPERQGKPPLCGRWRRKNWPEIASGCWLVGSLVCCFVVSRKRRRRKRRRRRSRRRKRTKLLFVLNWFV